MNYALAQLATKFQCQSVDQFTDQYRWTVSQVKDDPTKILCYVSAKDKNIVGVKEITLKRHDIKMPFDGFDVIVDIDDLPTMRSSDLIKILNTRYGVDIRESEVVDDVISTPTTTLTIHPLSPQWYGTLLIKIQE